ncbi:MAG: class IV adenylate cyclase [Nanoarchaeota archaeon]
MAWFEVETKIKIKNPYEAREKIKRIANFTKKETKKDFYFKINQQGYPHKAFRIRNDGKTYTVNFKKWIKNLWNKQIVVKQEFEFKISNLDNFLELMTDLKFTKWLTKIKHSETYKNKRNTKVSIELNNVEKLGWFVEVEYLAKKHEIHKAKKEIIKTLKELNIKQDNIDNTGYTKMLWKKK